MAALERSSWELMCTRIFTWWSSRRAGAIPSRRSVSQKQRFCIGRPNLRAKPRKCTQWMKELLANSQPILVGLQQKIAALTVQLQSAASPEQPRGLGKMTSVVIDREIGDWNRFSNRRQIASYTGLCPGEYSSGNTRLQSCVTKHGNPRLRAALVELAWRLVRFQPNYHPLRKWRQILAKGALATGAARKKAIVAVARQLAVDLWRIKTGQLRSEELGLIN